MMSNEQVPASLRELLADIFEISSEQVTPELSMETLDSWDSFRHLQAILAHRRGVWSAVRSAADS